MLTVEPVVGEITSKGPYADFGNVAMAAPSAPVLGSPSKFCEYAGPVKLSIEADSMARCSSNSRRGLNPELKRLLHRVAGRPRWDFCDR